MHIIFCVFVQFAPVNCFGDETLRLVEHHHDQKCAVNQKSEFGKFSQEFREPYQQQCADNHAGETTHSTDDNKRKHIDRNQQHETVRIDC